MKIFYLCRVRKKVCPVALLNWLEMALASFYVTSPDFGEIYGRFWMEENLQEQGAVPSQGKPTHTALLPYLPTLRVCSLRTQPDNAQLLRHPACRDLRRSNILLYESKRHCQLYHVLQDAEESVRKRRCKALLKVWRRNTTTHSASVRLHVTKQRRSSKRMGWGS